MGASTRADSASAGDTRPANDASYLCANRACQHGADPGDSKECHSALILYDTGLERGLGRWQGCNSDRSGHKHQCRCTRRRCCPRPHSLRLRDDRAEWRGHQLRRSFQRLAYFIFRRLPAGPADLRAPLHAQTPYFAYVCMHTSNTCVRHTRQTRMCELYGKTPLWPTKMRGK